MILFEGSFGKKRDLSRGGLVIAFEHSASSGYVSLAARFFLVVLGIALSNSIDLFFAEAISFGKTRAAGLANAERKREKKSIISVGEFGLRRDCILTKKQYKLLKII